MLGIQFEFVVSRSSPIGLCIMRFFVAADSMIGGDAYVDDIFKLCDVVRETGYAIHTYLRNGHLEKVYENALAHRLRKRGLHVVQQYGLRVFDEDGTALGTYEADLFLDSRLIIEVKACKTLADEHTAQILGYMRASRVEHGLLINFGGPRFQIKKLILTVDQSG